MSGAGDFAAFAEDPHTRARGKRAEREAVAWLENEGYRIVDVNVTTAAGEIDVVAWEGETLCFIEVKAKGGTWFGPAIAAVDQRKRRRLVRCARYYLAFHLRGPADPYCRFDVVGMDPSPEGWRYTLVRDAFLA